MLYSATKDIDIVELTASWTLKLEIARRLLRSSQIKELGKKNDLDRGTPEFRE